MRLHIILWTLTQLFSKTFCVAFTPPSNGTFTVTEGSFKKSVDFTWFSLPGVVANGARDVDVAEQAWLLQRPPLPEAIRCETEGGERKGLCPLGGRGV